MNYVTIKNNQSIPLTSIPVLEYKIFMELNVVTLIKNSGNHCVNYFGYPDHNKIKLICCIADDEAHSIHISSSEVDTSMTYPSFTANNLVFEKFEREIHENYGIRYYDHPWLKPVRYPNPQSKIRNPQLIKDYPFFKINSEELHEVGVGPIHAGIIEPGHFRFICNGEQIMHLEIQLGYQHRGIERLMTEKKKLLQRIILAESIAGDTVAGHTVAFVNLWESLCGFEPTVYSQLERTLALELERIAICTGDLSALCTDIAYQLGAAVFGRLRTPVINFLQEWCGNRLAKGLIRPGRNNYPFTYELKGKLLKVLEDYEPDFDEMIKVLTTLPSALARFEKTGVVTNEQAKLTGLVGMAARMAGVSRDIRVSHTHDLYKDSGQTSIIKHHGDVYSRVQIRREEIWQSIKFIRKLLTNYESEITNYDSKSDGWRSFVTSARVNSQFVITLVEGWRGEICHCAITDENGELLHYKIKDPSFHNWIALALSVRNNEISDFPVSNKSFNLSYCAHDL